MNQYAANRNLWETMRVIRVPICWYGVGGWLQNKDRYRVLLEDAFSAEKPCGTARRVPVETKFNYAAIPETQHLWEVQNGRTEETV